MDQREFHLQPFGICYKLYQFTMKTIASQVLKTVTLGHPTHYRTSSTALRGSSSKAGKEIRIGGPSEDGGDKELPPTRGGSIPSLAGQGEEKNNACMNIHELEGENKTLSLPKTSLPQAKPPKKTVSINDNVEEIVPSKKKKRRSRSFQKSSSLDQNEEEEEEPKPLRSILKVGSDLNGKSNSTC